MSSFMRPDAATLMLAAVLVTPLIAAANIFLWRQTHDRALLWWAAGSIAMSAGILVELGGSDRVALSTLGGICLIVSQWLFFRGVQVYHADPARAFRVADRVLFALLLLSCLTTVLFDQVLLGRAVTSLAIALIAGGCAYLLMLSGHKEARASALFTGGIFALNALLHGVSAMSALFASGPTINWPLVEAASFLLLIGWSFGFLMLIGQRNQERLAELANHDELTGADTRRSLLEKGRHLFAMAARQGPTLGVMMLDIDFFKQVNDAHGHAAGDEVLKNFSRIVSRCMRASDVFGRLGGEEFCVLLPDTGLEGTTNAAERICAEFAGSSVEVNGKRVAATVSIGIAVCSPEIKSLDALIARADEALYRAKSQGRDRVVCAGAEESVTPMLRLEWDARHRSGNDTIDREHEYLVSWGNALVGKMQTNADNRVIEADIRELLHWLKAHFRHEEAILSELGWDGLPRHIKQHHALEKRGAQLLAEVQSGKQNFAELLDFIVLEIVARHLARHDAQYFHLTKAVKP